MRQLFNTHEDRRVGSFPDFDLKHAVYVYYSSGHVDEELEVGKMTLPDDFQNIRDEEKYAGHRTVHRKRFQFLEVQVLRTFRNDLVFLRNSSLLIRPMFQLIKSDLRENPLNCADRYL